MWGIYLDKHKCNNSNHSFEISSSLSKDTEHIFWHQSDKISGLVTGCY